MPATYARFKRLPIPDVVRAFDDTQNLFVQMIAGRKFRNVLEQHMGYWEKRVPDGKQCFVHYAIGPQDIITAAFNRIKGDGSAFTLLGVITSSRNARPIPSAFHSATRRIIGASANISPSPKILVFWFNFFPEQPYLFEKTFAVWALFQMLQLAGRGENNQLVAFDGRESLIAQGVSDFVLVNLNRFTSLPGFFNAAHEAGKHTFTVDPDYIWYGMLLKKM